MTIVDGSLCVSESCPLLVDGTCLENYGNPRECPNFRETADDTPLNLGNLSAQPIDETYPNDGDTVLEDDAVSAAGDPQLYIGGDDALSLTEAGQVASSKPSQVVMIAGEYESGKTTLVVELFAQFLTGPFGGWSFAGSETLVAFDRRHAPARLSSGANHPTTSRTQDDDMRLLHLELANTDRRSNLLLSDVKGEFFDDLVNIGNVAETVPLAGRADLCVFVINGALLGKPESRAQALWRARLLMGALTETDGLSAGTPTLIVVSKADLLDAPAVKEILHSLSDLADFAIDRGLHAQTLAVGARPDDLQSEPTGLIEFLDWLTTERDIAPNAVAYSNETGRFFWRSGI